jgi:uncharacterized membrane protein
MPKNTMLTALGAVVALGIGSSAIADSNSKVQSNTTTKQTTSLSTGFEKCYGIAKAGKNDCASGNEACSGQSRIDGAKNAWIALPKGTCAKIVGGNLTEGPSA